MYRFWHDKINTMSHWNPRKDVNAIIANFLLPLDLVNSSAPSSFDTTKNFLNHFKSKDDVTYICIADSGN